MDLYHQLYTQTSHHYQIATSALNDLSMFAHYRVKGIVLPWLLVSQSRNFQSDTLCDQLFFSDSDKFTE